MAFASRTSAAECACGGHRDSELTEATAANAIFIHDAAAEWDGTNPVRNLLG